MSNHKDERIHLSNIIDNYENMEADIVKQLKFKWDKHGTTVGSNRENIWKELFERFIPKKFKIEQNVFVIDSKGHCSSEVDLAIFDEQYTPYIFNHGVLKFIPVEAVAAVIECKSAKPKDTEVENWLKNMNSLMTVQDSVVRIAGRIAFSEEETLTNLNEKLNYINTQTATRPIKILCYISETKGLSDTEKKGFDIVIEANQTQEKLGISFKSTLNDLYEWYLYLNHTEDNRRRINDFLMENKVDEGKYLQNAISGIQRLKKYSLDQLEVQASQNRKTNLLSFIFQFNQLLMLINNPIFFPHRAYVNMFSQYLTESKNKKAREE